MTPEISVCMITYNHAKFIEQAINGVLKQKIDVPIVKKQKKIIPYVFSCGILHGSTQKLRSLLLYLFRKYLLLRRM